MTTYVYETIPDGPGDEPEYFEVKQSMKDPALKRHPQTGKPVRRVMLGGYGVLMSGEAEAPRKRSASAKPTAERSARCGCGPGCRC